MGEAVRYELDGHVATITYNRPEALNAVNGEVRRGLNEAFGRFRDEEDAWVAIVTGAGKAFCAGGDIRGGGGGSPVGDFPGTFWEKPTVNSFESGWEIFKPVIAAVNGYCLGYGLTLVSWCDFVIASERAEFGFPEVRLGVPTIVGAIRLPQRLNWQYAMELLLTGDRIDAPRALEIGLAGWVVPHDDLMTEARALADRLLQAAPLAARATKEVAVRSQHLPPVEAIRFGETMRKVAGATEDAAEGGRAARASDAPRSGADGERPGHRATRRPEAVFDPRLPGTIHETVARITDAGGRAVAVRADLADEDDVDRLVDEARDALGPVDLLVNNAAVTVPGRPPPAGAPLVAAPAPTTDAPPRPRPGSGSFLEFPLKGYKLHFQVGLFATYRLMQRVLPDMIERGRGAIVNISSVAAYLPGEGPYDRPGRGPLAYGGNKAAMHHLTEAVASEVAHHGIPVNVLIPSEPVLTPGNLVAAAGEENWASAEDFAEATIRVALADPATTTGRLLWSDDVLHPERGERGWLRAT